MSTVAFDETRQHELTAEGHEAAEFEWEKLLTALEGSESNPLLPEDVNKAAVALNVYLSWCWDPVMRLNGNRAKRLERVGRRLAALLWVIGPERFNDTSLTRFAARFGIHKVIMSEITAEFSRRFGIRNKKQEHGSNFKPGK